MSNYLILVGRIKGQREHGFKIYSLHLCSDRVGYLSLKSTKKVNKKITINYLKYLTEIIPPPNLLKAIGINSKIKIMKEFYFLEENTITYLI